jgi:hypothetical protein
MRVTFGEDLASAGTDCVSVTFFAVFVDFMTKFKAAHKQNMEWKEIVRPPIDVSTCSSA